MTASTMELKPEEKKAIETKFPPPLHFQEILSLICQFVLSMAR